ncbi:MAG: hypothetical protein GY906_38960 [bacterium]|nr:hypothetical protein [bacterium]
MDEQIDRLNEVLVSHQCAAKTATDAAEKNLAEERRRTTIAQSKVRQLEGTVKAADTNAGRHMNLTNEQKLRINGLHNTNREQTDHIEKLEAFIATMTNAAGGMAETLLSFARMEFRRKALDVKGGSDGKRCH